MKVETCGVAFGTKATSSFRPVVLKKIQTLPHARFLAFKHSPTPIIGHIPIAFSIRLGFACVGALVLPRQLYEVQFTILLAPSLALRLDTIRMRLSVFLVCCSLFLWIFVRQRFHLGSGLLYFFHRGGTLASSRDGDVVGSGCTSNWTRERHNL